MVSDDIRCHNGFEKPAKISICVYLIYIHVSLRIPIVQSVNVGEVDIERRAALRQLNAKFIILDYASYLLRLREMPSLGLHKFYHSILSLSLEGIPSLE